MAINYSGTTIGTFTLCQPLRERNKETNTYELVKTQEVVKCTKRFNIQIRLANVFFCAVHVCKIDNPDNHELCWRHELISFFLDEGHLKRCLKKGDFEYWFSGKLTNIKLNIYYKDMLKIAKYMVKSGLKVQVYYKEPKKK